MSAIYRGEFAPGEGMVAPAERPWRDELCLNGRWQFQPAPVPGDYVRDRGEPPELAPPDPGRWEQTPIKIPSPWNVNAWGGGRAVGEGTPHPYWPGSVTYPSYPPAWDGVEMGWLRRRFRVPAGWKGRRLILRFEAVAGECRVLVNGRRAGEHFDSYTPFQLDVTALVRPDRDNELLVGVRRRHLFNKTDPQFPRFRAPYAIGSNTDHLGGIWQDVFLRALPPVHVADVFVKPDVARGLLEVEVTLANAGTKAERVQAGGSVAPWIRLTGRLGAPVLRLPAVSAVLPAGGRATRTLRVPVGNRLKLWSSEAPHLHGLLVSVAQRGRTLDRHYTRFGWRQFTLRGRDLRLNGRRIQLFGDLVHPFGAFVMSRRYAWAWYRMVKDFGGNAVRLHAQPLPRFYLDLADEMGICVLDETALFGSSLQLNFAEPVAWERFAAHYDDLIRRDRNHPSVFGWSFGNELFAIFEYNKVPPAEADRWYARLAELGLRARRLDPTREWISCDGDEDLRGALPVWSKHLGHGLHPDAIPKIDKPRMVGESGGTYYAKPPLLAEFNGDRAYESYRGRSEALAIDLYQNVVRMARPDLAFFSASETVWFGLEHLPFGYRDFSRLPDAGDGVFFARPFAENKPGWQPERLPPYVATLNPGWDSDLPLYRPLPMFEAMRAALAPGGPAPSPWDHRPAPTPRPAPPAPTIEKVAFFGPGDGDLQRQLLRWGAPLTDEDREAGMLVIGASHLTDVAPARQRIAGVLERGGIVLVLLGPGWLPVAAINALLPVPLGVTPREATMLVPKDAHPWTASLGLPDLYFAENAGDKRILKQGLAGPFVAQGKTLLEAGNSDWSLFDAGENVKCGALVLYEHLRKPEGAALVVHEQGRGQLAVTTIAADSSSPAHAALWRKLLAGMGVRLGAPVLDKPTPTAPQQHDLLRDGPPAR